METWSLSYHASAAGKEAAPLVTEVIRLPELVLYDHAGFGGASARTNLSFHYIGDYWNDRIIVSSSVTVCGDFFATTITRALLGSRPSYYESFFAEKGPTTSSALFSASR